ncbi:MAG: GGDEF domain-containing protein, partial [Desulfitobacteriaceae bacterium]
NLRTAVREEDIVARTGGDEFTIVLTDLARGQEALVIMERLKEELSLDKYGLGVSIGVAEFPTEARDYEGLYRLADQRLYEGKNNGKGKIVTGKEG